MYASHGLNRAGVFVFQGSRMFQVGYGPGEPVWEAIMQRHAPVAAGDPVQREMQQIMSYGGGIQSVAMTALVRAHVRR